MEKLFLALTYVVLNIGLYVLFASSLASRFSKVVKVVFVIVFILTCILLGVLGGDIAEESHLSFSLLVFYFIGYVLYKFGLPFFESQGISISKKLRTNLVVLFLGAFTLFATVVQLLMLYDLL